MKPEITIEEEESTTIGGDIFPEYGSGEMLGLAEHDDHSWRFVFDIDVQARNEREASIIMGKIEKAMGEIDSPVRPECGGVLIEPLGEILEPPHPYCEDCGYIPETGDGKYDEDEESDESLLSRMWRNLMEV